MSRPFQFRSRQPILDVDNRDSDGNVINQHYSLLDSSTSLTPPVPPATSPTEPILGVDTGNSIRDGDGDLDSTNIINQLDSSASLTSQVPHSATTITTTSPETASATIDSESVAHSVTTITMSSEAATIGSIAHSASTITTTASETPPIAPSSSEAQLISGGAGVIVSERQSVDIDEPVNPEKGKTKLKRKTATKQARVGIVGDTDPTPRRVSTRTIDLKRKKMDSEVLNLNSPPAKKKKTTVKERWVYVNEEPNAMATTS